MSYPDELLNHFDSLAYCAGKPNLFGLMRVFPEDFRVSETLAFEPLGSGEHAYLRIRKRQLTTRQVAARLARQAGVAQSSIGYAGMKDKHAVAEQWFSVALGAGTDPDWRQLGDDRVQVLAVTRHARKLKRGALCGNHFIITIRQLSGDPQQLTKRFARITRDGVPNYFGAQRFGINDGNLKQARFMFEQGIRLRDRYRRGLYLSAARSLLFNRILAQRVADKSWNQILPGDVMILDQRRGWFLADAADDDLALRLRQGDIHPSGPLWGQGRLDSTGVVASLEKSIAAQENSLCEGLVMAKMKQERRALRVLLQAPVLQIEKTSVKIEFSLPSGSYATAVMRELVNDLGWRVTVGVAQDG